MEHAIVSINEKIIARNYIQSDSFVGVHSSNKKLFQKFRYFDSNRKFVKHMLATLEHETVEFINGNNADEAVANMKLKLRDIHPYLREYGVSNDDKQFDLSRVVYEQRKLIAHQKEELKMAKEELSNFIEKNASQNSDFMLEKDKVEEMTRRNKELSSLLLVKDDMIESLKAKNLALINRMESEK